MIEFTIKVQKQVKTIFHTFFYRLILLGIAHRLMKRQFLSAVALHHLISRTFETSFLKVNSAQSQSQAGTRILMLWSLIRVTTLLNYLVWRKMPLSLCLFNRAKLTRGFPRMEKDCRKACVPSTNCYSGWSLYQETQAAVLWVHEYYKRRKKTILENMPQSQYRKKLSNAEEETWLNVFTAWELSFQQLWSEAPGNNVEAKILTILAFLD